MGLRDMSKKYREDARYLNVRNWYMKLGIVGFIVMLFLLYVRFWWWV